LYHFPTTIDRREVAMSELLDFPTCYVCRSIELEIVINEDFGPMTTCTECGSHGLLSMKS
jgi:hypothetical protein